MKKISIFLMMLCFACFGVANAQQTLTVCNGTVEEQHIPFYAYSGDTQGTTSEFIIPESNLTALNGKTITALKFYLSQSQSKTWTAVYQVYMAEVATTQLTRTIGPDAGTIVYQGTVDASGSEMTITFNQGNYTYNGGHLLIGTYVATDGAWDSNGKFYGITATAASYLSGSWGGYDDGGFDFIPKTTFSYLSDDPYIILAPASATVLTGFTETLTATYGHVTGTPTITYSSSNTSVATVTGNGTTATVTGVAPGTATITATMTVNGTNYTGTCDIIVEDPSYCTPSYSQTSDYIKSFVTTGGTTNINNTNTGQGTGGYSDFYNSHSASISDGETLSFTVTRGYSDSYKYAIWVDWNHDYVFDVNTETVASVTTSQYADWEGSFTIPVGTAAGDYRMRVEMLYGSSNTLNPCVSASYGEVEDYMLTVFAASTDPSITLTPATATVFVGITETLTAVVRNVTSPTITYTSSNTSVATVTGNGTTATVTGVAVGTATITASMTVSGTTYISTSTITVTTDPCLKTIPYTYGFEDATDFSCWSTVDCETTNSYSGIVSSSTTDPSHSGSYLFAFSSYDGNTDPQYLISPSLSGVVNGVHVEFYYKIVSYSSAPETFQVGYSTTNSNVSSFTWVDSKSTSAHEYEHFTANYMGNVKYVAVKYTTADSYFLILDDFTIEEAPSCLEPTNVVASNETTTSATISWTAGGSETEWDIYFTTNSSDVPTASTTPSFSGLTTNSFNTITNNYTLTPATTYYVYVRSACSVSETSAWSTPCIFNTECNSMSLPYSETFEAGDLTVCWTPIIESPVYMSISVESTNPYEGTYHLNLDRRTPNGTQIIVLPEVDAAYALSNAEVSFYAMLSSGGYSNYTSSGRTLTIGVMTDPNDESTFVAVGSAVEPTSSYAQYTFDLSSYTGNGQYIAIKHDEVTSGNNGYTYIDNLEVTVNAYTKTIQAVGADDWAEGKGGYYLIASPLANNVDPTTIGMTTGDYDLYSFDQAEADEWRNYTVNNFDLVNGQGYLYASKEGTTLTFTGAAGTNGTVTLSKTNDNTVDFQGWNLVGNPFGVEAYINKPFYTLENSDTYTENTAGTAIQLMQGLFVVADNDGETLTFSTVAPSKKVAKLNMNVSKGNSVVDHAILSFSEGQQLPKLQFRKNSTKVYMPMEGKDYAIVSTESNVGEMPVNFKAENNGTYTLSFTTEEVSFAYLHLIDNMTGIETDLLATPSYSFEAKTTDYESRFKLVFATGNNDNDAFAFYSNGSFVINNEGEATLQVIDVNGRILKSESINGCANVNVKAAAGVYMLRLVNGNDVKVQKVVVR